MDPDHRFDTTQITVDLQQYLAGTLTLTLHTMFNGSDSGARYGHPICFATDSSDFPARPTITVMPLPWVISQTEAAGVYTRRPCLHLQ